MLERVDMKARSRLSRVKSATSSKRGDTDREHEQLRVIRTACEEAPDLLAGLIAEEFTDAAMMQTLADLLTPDEFDSVVKRLRTAIIFVLLRRSPGLSRTAACDAAGVSYSTWRHGETLWMRGGPLIERLEAACRKRSDIRRTFGT